MDPVRGKTLDTGELRQKEMGRIRGRAWMAKRAEIMARDGYTCQGCGIITRNLEVDHRIPLHQGGTNDDDNLQSLCKDCHKTKSAEEQGTGVGVGKNSRE